LPTGQLVNLPTNVSYTRYSILYLPTYFITAFTIPSRAVCE
jgi:hypothetical protein